MKKFEASLSWPCARVSEPPGIFPVIDGHVDLLYHMMRQYHRIPFSDLFDGQLTPQTLARGRVRIIVSAFYCADVYNGPQTSGACLRSLMTYADEWMRGLYPVRTLTDLRTCFGGSTPPGVLFLLENADALVDWDLADIKKRGFLVIGLTHAGSNRIGDGNGVKNPDGLRVEGRELVKKLDRQGFVIDVAHLAEPCFWEVVDIFSGPLISSHTGLRNFCDLPRNLSVEQARVLLERQGMVGVAVNPEMLRVDRKAGMEDVFRQIDWLVQKIGITGVGIGSDFGGFDLITKGLEDYSRLDSLAEQFIRQGYPTDAVGRIMGGNWYRFYAARIAEQNFV